LWPNSYWKTDPTRTSVKIKLTPPAEYEADSNGGGFMVIWVTLPPPFHPPTPTQCEHSWYLSCPTSRILSFLVRTSTSSNYSAGQDLKHSKMFHLLCNFQVIQSLADYLITSNLRFRTVSWISHICFQKTSMYHV